MSVHDGIDITGQAKGERGQRDTPVSYTHLDVYKRQVSVLHKGGVPFESAGWI